MAEVAQAAGVSQQTVSRVVNGHANVSEQTRARVLSAIRELGFRPNFAGKSLRSGRYNSLGLCLYNVDQFGNLATVKGILSAAGEMGYAVTMLEMDDRVPLSLNEATRRMMALPIDALIISMSIKASDFERFSPQPGLSTVLLSMYEHPLCTTVDSDQYECSRLVMEHLLSRGHREIRFVSGPTYSVDSVFREKGWRDELLAHGLYVSEPLRGDWTARSGYEAGLKLARDPRVTAVYVANDQMAVGVWMALEAAGRHVPDDVSIVGVDDSLERTLPNVRLTTVHFDLFKRGRTAVEHALLGSGPGYQSVAIRIPPALVVRDSVADVR
ncbi:MAG TPA: LacI family DNA-binding transcriptional regulator [Candidatus Olsenella stercoravium]|uniref:LacI family DNA-binding transcriptional regulator n=1 Tax=Candidatus Olsenella stercoravium TaxID=2838713 RepID=A0A9D2INR7_9ACTN|nr:LacI family DNA-binding transcriptional regulator [Candidatus Olsenella stercoravium]